MFRKRKRANAVERWDEAAVADFIHAGGAFSLDEWFRLDPTTRANVAEIARRVKADEIATLAAAIHDPDIASRLGAQADDGAARERDVKTGALYAIGRKIAAGGAR